MSLKDSQLPLRLMNWSLQTGHSQIEKSPLDARPTGTKELLHGCLPRLRQRVPFVDVRQISPSMLSDSNKRVGYIYSAKQENTHSRRQAAQVVSETGDQCMRQQAPDWSVFRLMQLETIKLLSDAVTYRALHAGPQGI
jgi:hypothetical protein